MKRRIPALCLSALLLLSLSACGERYAAHTLRPNEFLLGESVTDTGEIVTPAPREDAAQLTAEDIQSLNGGQAELVYGAEGYITFLQGRFSESRVENYEDAVASLNGVAALIGLGAGSEFFAVYYGQDDDGYTYYTFQQRYGDVTVQYATLRVVVDPAGYTAGLSCSFTPNLGIAAVEREIGADEAESVVRQKYSALTLNFYPDAAQKVAVTIDEISYRAWVIYTNNPNANARDFDMAYYEHFVSVSGEYLYCLPVASVQTDRMDAFQAEEYFTALEPLTLNATVTRWDGSRESISVPIAYNANTGLYYLADPQRKMMVADFHTVIFRGVMDFVVSADGTSWENGDLLAYDRYIKAYDFYAAQGIRSVDGTGTPILVCTGYCDAEGKPVDNAGYCGIHYGWACFGASDVNRYSEALDVVGHEFTHGVTRHSLNGTRYCNETGAISEAYSDILGNLCEMLTGSTADTTWLMGENCGPAIRSLRSPGDYAQPISTKDLYYQPPSDAPGQNNDNGGVHRNSSLLAQMAWKLYDAGMSLEQQRALWVTSIELLTPLSGYREVHAALRMSIDINGFDAAYKDVLTQAFTAAGLLG